LAYQDIILSSLQKTGSLQVGEHLDDVLGHRGRSGQMVTGGLETVFIGDPVDGDDDAIGRSVRVRSLGDCADILRFRSDLLLAAALGDFGAILTLETVEITISVNANSRIILASNYTYVDLRK
jgi:hypothetical protein